MKTYNVKSRIDTGLKKPKFKCLTESEKSSIGDVALNTSLNKRKLRNRRREREAKSKSPFFREKRKTPTRKDADRSVSGNKRVRAKRRKEGQKDLTPKIERRNRARITKIKTRKSPYHPHQESLLEEKEPALQLDNDATDIEELPQEEIAQAEEAEREPEEEKIDYEALERKRILDEASRFQGLQMLLSLEQKGKTQQSEQFIHTLKCIYREYEIQVNFARELRIFSLKRSLFENLRKAAERCKHRQRLLRNFSLIFNYNVGPRLKRDMNLAFRLIKKTKGRPFNRLRNRPSRRTPPPRNLSKSPNSNSTSNFRGPEQQKMVRAKKSRVYKSKSGMKPSEMLNPVTLKKEEGEELAKEYVSKRERARAYDQKNRKKFFEKSGKKHHSRSKSSIEALSSAHPKFSETANLSRVSQTSKSKISKTPTEQSSPLQNSKIVERIGGVISRDHSARGSRMFAENNNLKPGPTLIKVQESSPEDRQPRFHHSPKFEGRQNTPIGSRNRYKFSKMSPSSGAPTEKAHFSSQKKEEEHESISTDIRILQA